MNHKLKIMRCEIEFQHYMQHYLLGQAKYNHTMTYIRENCCILCMYVHMYICMYVCVHV